MDFDVVVAGAGPVGLLLAAELKAAGVSVLLVERNPDAVAPIKEGEMGGRSLNAPSTFALHHRGLLPTVQREAMWWFTPQPEDAQPEDAQPEDAQPEDAQPEDTQPEAAQSEAAQSEAAQSAAEKSAAAESKPAAQEPVFAGHFAGIPLRAELIAPDDPDIGSHVHGAGVISIGAFERILRDRAVELGVPIRYDTALTALAPDDTGVTVEVGGQTLRAGWLVGADGGRSTVRKLAGFDFPGADPVIGSRLVLVDMDEPELLLPGGLHETDNGSYILGGWERRLRPTRLILMEPVEQAQLPADRDAPITADEIEQSIKRITGIDTHVTAIHAASRYTDHTRQASTYRRGRILLVGDAAHVHSPAGGQGMNLGVGDAMNLGWKLAATVRGWAPDGLLDSYTEERHPIGAWVQAWSLAQTALARLDPQTRALHGVVADLLNSTPGVMYVLKKISGVAQHYDLPGAHPLVGRMAPDFALADGTLAAQHSDSGHFILLQRAGTGISADHLAAWADQLKLLTLADDQATSPAAILIRPDGYIALATDEPADAEAVRDTLAAHLGANRSATTEPCLPAMH